MDMQATGTIQITDELELINPFLDISKVSYDWQNYKVIIECHFKENGVGYIHSRSFEFVISPTGEMTTGDIINLINNHPTLNVFE